MFVGSNLVLHWVPGSGKVVRGDKKMSPGRVSPGVLQSGVNALRGKCLFHAHVLNFTILLVCRRSWINKKK